MVPKLTLVLETAKRRVIPTIRSFPGLQHLRHAPIKYTTVPLEGVRVTWHSILDLRGLWGVSHIRTSTYAGLALFFSLYYTSWHWVPRVDVTKLGAPAEFSR